MGKLRFDLRQTDGKLFWERDWQVQRNSNAKRRAFDTV